MELFEEYETEAFLANGFYSYNDFLKFASFIGIDERIAVKIIEEFLSYEDKTLELLELSFLSEEAKIRYRILYLDRVKAVSYKYKKI